MQGYVFVNCSGKYAREYEQIGCKGRRTVIEWETNLNKATVFLRPDPWNTKENLHCAELKTCQWLKAEVQMKVTLCLA